MHTVRLRHLLNEDTLTFVDVGSGKHDRILRQELCIALFGLSA